MDKNEKSIGRLISILYRKSQIYINHALTEFGITAAEQSLLFYLYHNDGATQESAAAYLNIDKAACARAVSSLMKKGYVTKEKDSSDKRCNRIRLTEKAWENKKKLKERMKHWSDFLTEDMDEETREVLYDLLEKMVDKVKNTDQKTKWEEIYHGKK